MEFALAAVTNQKPFGLGRRAVFAGTAVGIVTVVLNVIGIGALKSWHCPHNPPLQSHDKLDFRDEHDLHVEHDTIEPCTPLPRGARNDQPGRSQS